MTILNPDLPKSMSRFVVGLSFLGLAFAGSAHAEDVTPPVLTNAYISSGGTLLVLQYNEPLNGSSVPVAGDFTVSDGAAVPVSAVHVVRDRVVLKLGKTILAVDENSGTAVVATALYDSGAIKDLAGNPAIKVQEWLENNSTKFPMSLSFNDPGGSIQCGAWKIEMDDNGVVTVFSTYCSDSMPIDTPVSGTLAFSEYESGSSPIYCKSFDSFEINSLGHANISTTDDCVVDLDADGIPGVVDAAPGVPAGAVCVEEEGAYGEVNLANVNATSCSGTVSVVTGKVDGNGVTVDSDTVFTAGEFIRLLPGFSVVQGAQFTARTGAFL